MKRRRDTCPDSQSRCPLLDMPPEIFFLILSHLSPRSIRTFHLVCRAFRQHSLHQIRTLNLAEGMTPRILASCLRDFPFLTSLTGTLESFMQPGLAPLILKQCPQKLTSLSMAEYFFLSVEQRSLCAGLTSATGLTSLTWRRPLYSLSDRDLPAVLAACPKLLDLSVLSGPPCKIEDQILQATALTRLCMSRGSSSWQAMLPRLASLPNLRVLEGVPSVLRGPELHGLHHQSTCEEDHAGLGGLSQLTRLQIRCIFGCEGLSAFTHLRGLRSLELVREGASNSHVYPLDSLANAVFYGTPLEHPRGYPLAAEELLEATRGMSRLEELSLVGFPVYHGLRPVLARLSGLTKLHLLRNHTLWPGYYLPQLLSECGAPGGFLGTLRHLHVDLSAVIPEGAAAFATTATALEHLHLGLSRRSSCHVVPHLSRLSRLTALALVVNDLGPQGALTPPAAPALAPLTRLVHLALLNVLHVAHAAEDVACIASLSRLERLALQGEGSRRVRLDRLLPLTRLRLLTHLMYGGAWDIGRAPVVKAVQALRQEMDVPPVDFQDISGTWWVGELWKDPNSRRDLIWPWWS
eukprot:jgi/Botrbrau1/17584/Bobra.0166s0026.1